MNPELLASLFGQADPRVPQGGALGAGLQSAGLGMILGSRGDGYTPTFIEVLAQGLLSGAAGASNFRQNALAQQNQIQMQEMAAMPPSPDNLARMMTHAIGAGNVDAARALSEVLKSMMAAGAAAGQVRPRFNRVVGDDGRFYEVARDPYTGREMYRNEIADPVSRYGTLEVEDPEGPFTNSRRLTRIDRLTGEVVPVEGVDLVDPSRTERQQQALAFISRVEGNVAAMNEFDNPRILTEDAFGTPVVAAITPQQERQLFTLSIPFVEAWLRMTTGAAYNDTEFTNASRLFVPMTGDGPEVREIKAKMRAMLPVMLKQAAGVRLSDDEQRLLDADGDSYRSLMQRARTAYDDALAQGLEPEEAAAQARRVFGGFGGGTSRQGPEGGDFTIPDPEDVLGGTPGGGM